MFVLEDPVVHLAVDEVVQGVDHHDAARCRGLAVQSVQHGLREDAVSVFGIVVRDLAGSGGVEDHLSLHVLHAADVRRRGRRIGSGSARADAIAARVDEDERAPRLGRDVVDGCRAQRRFGRAER